MKKFLSALAALTFAMSMSGCGNSDDGKTKNNKEGAVVGAFTDKEPSMEEATECAKIAYVNSAEYFTTQQINGLSFDEIMEKDGGEIDLTAEAPNGDLSKKLYEELKEYGGGIVYIGEMPNHGGLSAQWKQSADSEVIGQWVEPTTDEKIEWGVFAE